MIDAKDLAAQNWFGYGRWEAPYWFIGMEPGGDDEHASYEAWHALGAGELIDCRKHHLWKRDVLGIYDEKWTQWHEDRPSTKTQPTWRRLIQLLLAYKGRPTDLEAVYEYQKYRLGASDGETAIVELGALHAPGLFSEVDRLTHREKRVKTLRKRLGEHAPKFAVCYGYVFREQFEEVVGGKFDGNGFQWNGTTLCVLMPGPTSRIGGEPKLWIDKGIRMREMLDGRA